MDVAKAVDTVVARFIGTKHERDIKKLMPVIAEINAREAEVRALSDEEIGRASCRERVFRAV